jgi:hypothetical protein
MHDAESGVIMHSAGRTSRGVSPHNLTSSKSTSNHDISEMDVYRRTCRYRNVYAEVIRLRC